MFTRNLHGYTIEIKETTIERGYSIIIKRNGRAILFDHGYTLSGSIQTAHDHVKELRK